METAKNNDIFGSHKNPSRMTVFYAEGVENRSNFWQNIFGSPLPSKIAHYRQK
jgi:hypothetical protein